MEQDVKKCYENNEDITKCLSINRISNLSKKYSKNYKNIYYDKNYSLINIYNDYNHILMDHKNNEMKI